MEMGRTVSMLAPYACAMHIGLIAIVVQDYDPAIRFFVDALGFELVEDCACRESRPRL